MLVKRSFSVLFFLEIDECAEGTHECEHKCNNTVGGYNCSCHSGFQLDSDLKKCSGKTSSGRLCLSVCLLPVQSFITVCHKAHTFSITRLFSSADLSTNFFGSTCIVV